MSIEDFGGGKKELLFGVKFDFASDDEATEDIKNMIKSFLNETVGDDTVDNFDGFSFAETAQGR